jgi:outer membrane protein
MKKIILSVAAILAFGFANAQDMETKGLGFSNGDLFISGAIGINSAKTGDVKFTGFEIEPKIGFFVTEKIAIGGKLGFSSVKGENGSVDILDETAFTVGAFGRYYYCTPGSQFSLFGELGVDYSSIDDKIADEQEKEIGVGLGLGLNYFMSENFAIEAIWGGLGFTSNDNGGDGAEKTDTFAIGTDLRSISLGLLYKF